MVDVVCAVIVNNNAQVLACQRSETQSHPGKWEFPGGKVESGEGYDEALKREIEEELGCSIVVGEKLPAVEHRYETFAICLHPFLCKIEHASCPHALEHASIQWVSLAECVLLDWSEADKAIVKALIKKRKLL